MVTKKRAGGGVADDLVTMAEAARLRGVTPQAIDHLLARGRLRAVRVVGRRMLRRGDVLGFEPRKAGRPPSRKEKKR